MSTEHFTRVTFPMVGATERSTGADRGFVQGHAAGYAAGMRAAAAEQRRLQEQLKADHEDMLDAGRSAVAHAVLLLQAAAAAAQHRQEVTLEQVQDVLSASAIELAEAILGYELTRGENTARAALNRALAPLGGVNTVTSVRLHPGDLAALAASGVVDVPGVELKPDPTLRPGDAIGEYPHGWIDARIGTALERAKQALLGVDA
ncbi:flagellar assembly protein FliH [Paenarthrobacter nitroguajacolicus]|uniref:FliH/SctL family protein n=1 Tax=Paenarthrobacter nitroguajacolicus TaxID=211146 RepID=UPI00286215CB|nr:FliH/SctL family protein [Paenarthrobacter nitroguajacolicus]MDR6986199.1 flagellar assembly protein FliH [Paenarthrobacter nitroguajacolicus]